jgi:hypothetical protein
MTGAPEDTADGAPRAAPSNEPSAGAGNGASAAHETTTSSPTTTPFVSSATALRGRSNVYEKYLNKKMQVDDGPTAFGKRIQAAAGGIEVSNSNGGFFLF